MKKILYSEFNQIGGILDSVLKGSSLQSGLKKTTLRQFWGKIVGKKFEKVSKPESIQKNLLIVACANSFVTSELTMFKLDILKKLSPYTKSLNIDIKDIVFSHKIWKDETETENSTNAETQEHFFTDPDSIDYESIELDENELDSIKNCVSRNTFATEEQRKRMYDAIVKDLKYQKYTNEKNGKSE